MDYYDQGSSYNVPYMGYGATQRRQPAMGYDQGTTVNAGPAIGTGSPMGYDVGQPAPPPSMMPFAQQQQSYTQPQFQPNANVGTSPVSAVQSQIPPPGGGTLGSAGNLPPALQSWLRRFY